MAYRVEILPNAWEDSKHIEDWCLIQFGVETAFKVSDQILEAIERLEHFPDSGSLTPDEWLNQQGYRMVICERHVAIYMQVGEIIYIHHIADTQTEYTKLFYYVGCGNYAGNLFTRKFRQITRQSKSNVRLSFLLYK